MSAHSYFDSVPYAAALRKEALSWLRPHTPFHPHSAVKGSGADCIGFVSKVFSNIGATPEWNFPRTDGDWIYGDKESRVLEWMRGKVDDPQSKLLGEIFVELEIPKSVTDPKAETPRDFFKPGDVLPSRHGQLFHLPFIFDNDLHIVSALPRLGVIEGTIQDSTYSTHLVAVFRLKPKS